MLAVRLGQGQAGEVAEVAREALFCLHLKRVVKRSAVHLVHREVSGKLGIGSQRLFQDGSASEIVHKIRDRAV